MTTTTVSLSSVMTTAWGIARDAAARFGGRVRDYLSGSLRQAWATSRTPAASTIGERLLKVGNLWEKAGHRRIYFDIETICASAGFACGFYGTGNMSWASQDGESLSNTRGRRVYEGLRAAKIHYDLVEQEWSCMDTISDEMWHRIKAALIARAEAA